LQPLGSRPESLTDMVFEAIRDAIVNKALPPGSQVSEANLAAQLSVILPQWVGAGRCASCRRAGHGGRTHAHR
jgi:hypothetical protein